MALSGDIIPTGVVDAPQKSDIGGLVRTCSPHEEAGTAWNPLPPEAMELKVTRGAHRARVELRAGIGEVGGTELLGESPARG